MVLFGEAVRCPETCSMPRSLAILSASSLLGAGDSPPCDEAPAPPMSEPKILAAPGDAASAGEEAAGAGWGAGLPSKNLAKRDERPAARLESATAESTSRAAGDGEPSPGGARAMPRSSRIDLLGAGASALSPSRGAGSSDSIGRPRARRSRSRSRRSRSFICALNICMLSIPPFAPPPDAAGLYVSSSRAAAFPEEGPRLSRRSSSRISRACPSESNDILPVAGASIHAGEAPPP